MQTFHKCSCIKTMNRCSQGRESFFLPCHSNSDFEGVFLCLPKHMGWNSDFYQVTDSSWVGTALLQVRAGFCLSLNKLHENNNVYINPKESSTHPNPSPKFSSLTHCTSLHSSQQSIQQCLVFGTDRWHSSSKRCVCTGTSLFTLSVGAGLGNLFGLLRFFPCSWISHDYICSYVCLH